MTLWGCRLGAGFVQCVSTSHTLPHIIFVLVVVGAAASVLFYYGAWLVNWLLRS
jgi:hypothetical protein